jgi:hypothetical protein
VTAALLAVLLLLGAEAAPAPGSRARARAAAGPRGFGTPGEVRYVTATQAYLDRGLGDGVAVGMSITFTRAGRPVGACTVDTVYDDWATCLAGTLRKGDRFAIGRKVVEPSPGPPVELLGPEDLAVKRDQVEAAAQKQVEFDGDSGGAHVRRFSVTLGNTSYINFAGAGGSFQLQRVDAAVYDVEIWRGLRVSADLSVLNFSNQSSTFPSPGAPAPLRSPQVLVRQLEVGFRRSDVAFSGALGRVWTRYTPGMLVLDGAQASYRAGDWLETGVYGGLLPDAVTLTPVLTQWTAGAFAMARFQAGEGADSTLGQAELRAGYAVKDWLGGRVEVGGAMHLYQGRRFDGHLQFELAYGGPNQALAGIDAVRLDLGWRPVEAVRVYLGGRYRGESPAGVQEMGQVSPGLRAIHGDLGASWEVLPWLWLAAQGGGGTDLDAGVLQFRVGPEVTFPSLFGRFGSLAVGYTEEFGWLRAKYAYVQLYFNLFSRVRLVSRTSWFLQVTRGLAANEIGESINLDVTIFRWLWLRASMSGRTQLEPAYEGLPTDTREISRTSGVLSFQVGGQY